MKARRNINWIPFARAGGGHEPFERADFLASVETVAKELAAAGGLVAAAEVDALDERAVDEHLHSVIYGVGRVDISFNAVGILDAKSLGVPLAELDAAQFTRRIEAYATAGAQRVDAHPVPCSSAASPVVGAGHHELAQQGPRQPRRARRERPRHQRHRGSLGAVVAWLGSRAQHRAGG